MKTKTLILSHGAVFAVGAAIAIVAQRPDSESGGAAAPGGPVSTARASASAGSGDDSAAAGARERRDASSLADRTGQSATERLAGIVRIADPLKRQAALMELIDRLSPDEFAEVIAQYQNLDRYGDSRGEYEMILRGWVRADPIAALAYTSSQPNGRWETSIALAAWAGNDAAAAERWALENHQGDGPNPWMASVIRGIAAYDIAHASQLAEAMPFGRERAEAVDAITRALFVQGVDAAMAFPASIQDPQLRAGFVSEIAGRLAAKDPEQAATWLATNGDAESQNRASRRVAEALANKDPAIAAKWLPTLAPSAQAEAASGIIPIMSSGDLANITDTAKWVSSLAGLPNYDRVVEEFVWSCDQRAPEQSAAWIQGISDPAQQTRLYHRMLGGWARRDAEAVRQWVASNDVPNSVANRFK